MFLRNFKYERRFPQSMNFAAAGIGLMLFAMLLMVAAVIFGIVFWIMMIIDCAKRTFKNETEKIAWLLIIVFLHALGALIYYIAVKRAKN